MARKDYYYLELQFQIADEKDANFKVEYISDGNKGKTKINVPGQEEPLKIENAGSINIGKGDKLIPETTVITCQVNNPVPEEDKIEVKFYINDELLRLPTETGSHINEKSVSEQIRITLAIKFKSL